MYGPLKNNINNNKKVNQFPLYAHWKWKPILPLQDGLTWLCNQSVGLSVKKEEREGATFVYWPGHVVFKFEVFQ